MASPTDYADRFANKYTSKQYRRTLAMFYAYLAGRDPTIDLAKEWLATLHLSLGTKNKHIACLRGYLRTLGLDVATLQLNNYQAPKQAVLDWDTRDALIGTAKTPRDKAFLMTLVYSGLRWEGLSNLKWGGVHAKERELETVEKRGVRRTRDSKLGPVMVSRATIEAIEELKITTKKPTGPDDRVFAFSYRTALRIVKRAAKSAGIPVQVLTEIDPWGIKGLHSIRRGNATAQLRKIKVSDPEEYAQRLDTLRKTLSHTNIVTTLGYLYIDREKSRKYYDEFLGEEDDR